MVKNYRTSDHEEIVYDLSATSTGEGGIQVTIGATGPRRKCSPWQGEFEAWGRRFKLHCETEPDTGQKGIRRREVRVIVDTKTLLELILNDIAEYHDFTIHLDRNDEIFAAERTARKDKIYAGDFYVNTQKASKG